MSFGVAQSYLSALAGVAMDRGLIKDVNDPVWKYVSDGGFDSAHNTPNQLAHAAQPDQRMGGRAVGQARHRGSPARLRPQPARAGHILGVQRRARGPAGAVAAAGLEAAAATGPAGTDHGPDRRAAILGSGRATAIHLSISMGALCNRSAEAATGVEDCGRAPATTHASAICSCVVATGTVASLFRERWIGMATQPTDIAPQYGYLWWLNTGRKTSAGGTRVELLRVRFGRERDLDRSGPRLSGCDAMAGFCDSSTHSLSGSASIKSEQ